MMSLQGIHCFIICFLRHCSVLVSECLFLYLLCHYTIHSRFPLFHYLFVTSLLCSRLRLSLPLSVMSIHYSRFPMFHYLFVVSLHCSELRLSLPLFCYVTMLSPYCFYCFIICCYVSLLHGFHCFIAYLLRHYSVF